MGAQLVDGGKGAAAVFAQLQVGALLLLLVQTQQLLRVEDGVAAIAQEILQVQVVLLQSVDVELQEVEVLLLAQFASELVGFLSLRCLLRQAPLGEYVVLHVLFELGHGGEVLAALHAVEVAVHDLSVLHQLRVRAKFFVAESACGVHLNFNSVWNQRQRVRQLHQVPMPVVHITWFGFIHLKQHNARMYD